VVVIPSATVGLDTAYTTSASQAKPGEAYYFQDVRKTDDTSIVGSPIEVFQGRITTRTYDFDVPENYKVLFWWGIALATSGKIVTTLNIPNANKNFTYTQMRTLYGTWAAAQAAGVKWSNNTNIVIPDTVTPSLGGYARKFIKLPKKVRFRQVFFTVVFDVISNGGVADATLRVYDLTVFVKQKQGVVRETS
jgi:hypothetical protein